VSEQLGGALRMDAADGHTIWGMKVARGVWCTPERTCPAVALGLSPACRSTMHDGTCCNMQVWTVVLRCCNMQPGGVRRRGLSVT
jgi:hypothetical protein